MLTGNKHLDFKILEKLSDRDLLNFLLTNKNHYDFYQDETFWMNKTYHRYGDLFPLTIPQTQPQLQIQPQLQTSLSSIKTTNKTENITKIKRTCQYVITRGAKAGQSCTGIVSNDMRIGSDKYCDVCLKKTLITTLLEAEQKKRRKQNRKNKTEKTKQKNKENSKYNSWKEYYIHLTKGLKYFITTEWRYNISTHRKEDDEVDKVRSKIKDTTDKYIILCYPEPSEKLHLIYKLIDDDFCNVNQLIAYLLDYILQEEKEEKEEKTRIKTNLTYLSILIDQVSDHPYFNSTKATICRLINSMRKEQENTEIETQERSQREKKEKEIENEEKTKIEIISNLMKKSERKRKPLGTRDRADILKTAFHSGIAIKFLSHTLERFDSNDLFNSYCNSLKESSYLYNTAEIEVLLTMFWLSFDRSFSTGDNTKENTKQMSYNQKEDVLYSFINVVDQITVEDITDTKVFYVNLHKIKKAAGKVALKMRNMT